MKILLTITICLQLLQGEDAAKFDEKRENNEQEKKWKKSPDEPLLYDDVVKTESTAEHNNELKDIVILPPEPIDDTKSEWKELSDQPLETVAEVGIEKELQDTISDELKLDATLEQSQITGQPKINTQNKEMIQDGAKIKSDDTNKGTEKSPLEDKLNIMGSNQWENKQDDQIEMTDSKNSEQENVLTQASQITCIQHLSDIDTKQYSSNVMIGKSGITSSINENGENQGCVVRSLKFCQSKGYLAGLETELSNGTMHTVGLRGCTTETFYIRPDERITHLTIYTDKKDCNGAVTGVYFSTNKHRYFSTQGGKKNYYYQPQTLGSGILVGFKAQYFQRKGWWFRVYWQVNALTFLFLQEVESSTLSNVHYPNINSLSVIERPVHINRMRCNNKGSKTEQEFTFPGTRPVYETHQWLFGSTGLETQLTNTHVEASIVSITKSTGTSLTSNLVFSNPYIHGRKLNFYSNQKYNLNIKVPPGKEVMATATTYQGTIKTPYTGTLTVTLVTGWELNYTVNGIYMSRTTSNVVTTKDIA